MANEGFTKLRNGLYMDNKTRKIGKLVSSGKGGWYVDDKWYENERPEKIKTKREEKMKDINSRLYGYKKEHYKDIVNDWKEKMKKANDTKEYNFAKSQKEAWENNYIKTAGKENLFNQTYDNPEEAKYVSKMIDYNAKNRVGRYANYNTEDVVARDKENYEKAQKDLWSKEYDYSLIGGGTEENYQKLKEVRDNYNKVKEQIKEHESIPEENQDRYWQMEREMLYDKKNKLEQNDISPMSEYSDTTGTGYSDKQVKAYKDYLLKTQGTTDEDIINAGREPENRVSIEKFANEQADTEAKIERFNQRKGKTQETYTKSGNIRYSAFGIERTPEDDFSDDGTRFTAYRLPNGMGMTVAKDSDDIYLSVRTPNVDKLNLKGKDFNNYYKDITNLPHYKELDKYNGVRKGSVDLNEVIKNANAYKNEYNEYLKSKGIKPEVRTNKQLRLDSIKSKLEQNKSSIEYYTTTMGINREWRNQQLNKLYRKNERLRKELEKLQ